MKKIWLVLLAALIATPLAIAGASFQGIDKVSSGLLFHFSSGDLLLPANLTSNGNKMTVSVVGGGTGLNSGTAGGVPYYGNSLAMASSATLAAGQVVLGGGSGVAPSTGGAATIGAAAGDLDHVANGNVEVQLSTSNGDFLTSVSTPSIRLSNTSTTPVISMQADDSATPSYIIGSTTAAADTGANPVLNFSARRRTSSNAGADLTTRPLFRFQNNNTAVATVPVTGVWGFPFGVNLGNEDLTVYDEGSFTPAITCGTGAVTHSIQVGSFVKTGKSVVGQAYLQWTKNTCAGNVTVNIPFATKSVSNGYTPITVSEFQNITTLGTGALVSYAAAASTSAVLLWNRSANSALILQGADMTGGTMEMMYGFSYAAQ